MQVVSSFFLAGYSDQVGLLLRFEAWRLTHWLFVGYLLHSNSFKMNVCVGMVWCTAEEGVRKCGEVTF